MTSTTPYPSTATMVVSWILRILLAGIFLLAAVMKLTSQPMMVHEFATIGLGQGFRYLTGILEITGGIAILWPRTSALGALLLLAIDIGAFVAQIFVLHMNFIHTIVIGALLATVGLLQRGTLRPR